MHLWLHGVKNPLPRLAHLATENCPTATADDASQFHRKLKHPHVVELLGEFRRPEKDKWYIVLELVPGTSLQDLADEGREALSGAGFESSLNRL